MKYMIVLSLLVFSLFSFADELDFDQAFDCNGPVFRNYPSELNLSGVGEDGVRKIRIQDRTGSRTIVEQGLCELGEEFYTCSWGVGRELKLDLSTAHERRGWVRFVGTIVNPPRLSVTSIRCYVKKS